jgi:hypothetical protein
MHNGYITMKFMRSGQGLIVVLLLLSVLIVVGLSVASRSVTEVSLTTTEEESSRALSAAEAGVEAVINKSATTSQTIVGSTNDQAYLVGPTTTPAPDDTISFPDLLKSGDSVTLNLSGWLNTNSFTVCWGDESLLPDPATAAYPALETIVYYYDPAANRYYQTRQVWEAVNSQLPDILTTNQASVVTTNCPSDRGYKYSALIAPDTTYSLISTDQLKMMRLKLMFNDSQSHFIAVVGSTSFASQGINTPVTGQAGQTTRKVQVFERTPQPLSIFDFALLAGGTIQ